MCNCIESRKIDRYHILEKEGKQTDEFRGKRVGGWRQSRQKRTKLILILFQPFNSCPPRKYNYGNITWTAKQMEKNLG